MNADDYYSRMAAGGGNRNGGAGDVNGNEVQKSNANVPTVGNSRALALGNGGSRLLPSTLTRLAQPQPSQQPQRASTGFQLNTTEFTDKLSQSVKVLNTAPSATSSAVVSALASNDQQMQSQQDSTGIKRTYADISGSSSSSYGGLPAAASSISSASGGQVGSGSELASSDPIISRAELAATYDWVISSSSRDQNVYPNPTDFTLQCAADIPGRKTLRMTGFKVTSCTIPLSVYNINADTQTDKLLIWEGQVDSTHTALSWIISVPPGSYSVQTLISKLNEAVSCALPFNLATSAATTGTAVQQPANGNTIATAPFLRNSYEFSYDDNSNRCMMRSTVRNVSWGIQCQPYKSPGGDTTRDRPIYHLTNIPVTLVSSGPVVLTLTFPAASLHNMGPNMVFTLTLKSLAGTSAPRTIANAVLYETSITAANVITTTSITYTCPSSFSWPYGSDTTVVADIVPLSIAYGGMSTVLGFQTTPLVQYSLYPLIGTRDGNNPPASVTYTHHRFIMSTPAPFVAGDTVTWTNTTSYIGPSELIANVDTYNSFDVLKASMTVAYAAAAGPDGYVYVTGCYTGDAPVNLRGPVMVFLSMQFDGRNIIRTIRLQNHRYTGHAGAIDSQCLFPFPVTAGSLGGMVTFNESSGYAPVVHFDSDFDFPENISVKITDENGDPVSLHRDWFVCIAPMLRTKK
jgi:hypothetical protein